MPKQVLVNAFDMNCPTQLTAGTWRHPDSQAARYKDLSYWTELAQLLERGLFDGLFIADVIGIYDVCASGPEAALRSGSQIPVGDPLLLISAMAHVTEHLGFGITASTSFEHPYTFVRRFSTLDHLTEGAGRLEHSHLLPAERRDQHRPRRPAPARRPLRGRRRVRRGALQALGGKLGGRRRRDGPRALHLHRSGGVHPIEHEGTYFKVPGIHMCEPSPQRTPLLYQAGTSERGKTFAAENAEAIFVAAPSAEILARQIADVRARAAGAGRDPYDIKWLAWASRSKLRPFVKLARTIRKHKSGVLAAIELGISNARLEALNKSRASDQPPR